MILLRKAVRAIWGNKKTYIACGFLIAIGIYCYVAMSISSFALDDSKNIFYRDYHMADVFAAVSGAPKSVDQELMSLEGVNQVTSRLSYDARAEVSGSNAVITVRLISYDTDEYALNRYYISKGYAPVNDNELVLGEDFLTAHNLSPGDSITLIIEGSIYEFVISGAAISPEFVYVVKDTSTLFPDAALFSFAYVDYGTLASMVNKRGLSNDIVMTLDAGYVFDDIKYPLEDILDKYGLQSLLPRKDNLSNSMLEQEIRSIGSMATSLSSIFVAASMVILYLMLKRLVEQDRAQIGTLKAFGFTNAAVLGHYLTYGIVTGLLGGFIGVIGGVLSADPLLVMYGEFFKMPELASHQSMEIAVQGMIIGVGGGVLGSLMGAYSVVKLNPAEAMRPKPPKNVKRDILTLFPFIKWFLTSRGSMAVRSIGRSKVRSVFIVLGMTFSFGIMAVMNSMDDMMDSMVYNQYGKSQVYDAKITFNIPTDNNAALESLYALGNVGLAEPILEMPVTLKNSHIEEGVLITGLPPESSLYRIYDEDRKAFISPSENSIVLSQSVAKKLQVEKGNKVYISSPLIDEDRVVYVSEIAVQGVGGGAFMLSESLSDFLDLGDVATSVIFRSDEVSGIRTSLQDGDNISSIVHAKELQESLIKLMGTYTGMFAVMKVIGVFVALAIIYNTSSMSLSERKREYATLKLIGLQNNEVAEIMGFEYWLLSIAGMVLGVPFTKFLKESLNAMVDVELFSISTSTGLSAYIAAVAGCAAAVFISNYIAKRSIAKFDIVEVLKERE